MRRSRRSQKQNLLGSNQDDDILAEFKSKFSSIDPDELKGLLLIDSELQESSVMRFFKCSVDCARYALLNLNLKARQLEVQELRKHEIELARAKSRDQNPLSTSRFPHENVVDKFCNITGPGCLYWSVLVCQYRTILS